jgi:hypothetical protein
MEWSSSCSAGIIVLQEKAADLVFFLIALPTRPEGSWQPGNNNTARSCAPRGRSSADDKKPVGNGTNGQWMRAGPYVGNLLCWVLAAQTPSIRQ